MIDRLFKSMLDPEVNEGDQHLNLNLDLYGSSDVEQLIPEAYY